MSQTYNTQSSAACFGCCLLGRSVSTQKPAAQYYMLQAWEEDSLDTLKLIAHLRDVRDGKADQDLFHDCIAWLWQEHPLTLLANLDEIVKVAKAQHAQAHTRVPCHCPCRAPVAVPLLHWQHCHTPCQTPCDLETHIGSTGIIVQQATADSKNRRRKLQ